MPRILQINAQQYSRLAVNEPSLERCFAQLDGWKAYHAPDGELSLVFLTDDELAQIHDDFLDDPTPTDVITFPGDAEMDFAGEICVSVDRAISEAPKHGWSFAEELTLYLVHGWLHLAGHDDLDDEARAEMRKAEKLCLERLKSMDAMPSFTLNS
ncbi:rRNA maturation RNase YbeY [Cerasicoccus maritimus]|uniref:rRNA maturation RNase YbeY n=1 Tax=Cerasicoccus maritimus TaxID=490089 RepID=UPI002852C583|nr:rRNA maturation RNase YbeY [Cerasicoccus maritimus]